MRLRRELRKPRVRRIAWVVGHSLFVLVAVLGLALLNGALGLPAALVSPLPTLHRYWLPALFLVAYAAAWLAYAFVRLAANSADADPDLEQAWARARAELDRAGLDLKRLPVIAVLGRPLGGAGDFFAATGLPFGLRFAGDSIGVYATSEAIFLAVGVGSLAELVAERPAPPASTVAAPRSADLLDLLDGAPPPEEPPPPAPDASEWLPPPPAMADAAAPAAARLAGVARLLARDRRPYCPANGVVWLVPAAALDADREKRATAAVSADRDALDSAWLLDLPQQVCVVDAETTPGFRELVGALPAAARAERSLGVALPGRPAAGRAAAIVDGVDWLVGGLVGGLAAHRLAGDDPAAARAAWRCAAWWADRGPRLGRVAAHGLTDGDGRAALVAGVHLCATGADASDRGFAAAPLLAALAREDAVAWSAAARRADRGARRLAASVWAVAAAGIGGLVWLAAG